jgi:hypothetical protein
LPFLLLEGCNVPKWVNLVDSVSAIRIIAFPTLRKADASMRLRK